MFKDLIIPVFVVGGGLIAVNNIFGNNKYDKSGETVTDAEKDVVKKKLSYPISWYSQTADSIQMNLIKTWKSKVFWLDSEGNNAIHDVLIKLSVLKNRNDWNMLVAKFGKRSGYGVSIVYNETLVKWLIYFLEDKTYHYKFKGKTRKRNALTLAKSFLAKINVSI